jgi:hypothetical protein
MEVGVSLDGMDGMDFMRHHGRSLPDVHRQGC